MNKPISSSKYLKVFDPFLEEPSVNTSNSRLSQQQSCLYLKDVQTVKQNIQDQERSKHYEDEKGSDNFSGKFESNRISRKSSSRIKWFKEREDAKDKESNFCEKENRWSGKDSNINQKSKIKEGNNNTYEKQIEVLEKKIENMKEVIQEKDNKILLLTQHLQTLQFQLEISNKTSKLSNSNTHKSFQQILSSIIQQQMTTKPLPQYHNFLSNLSQTSLPQPSLCQLFTKLRQLYSLSSQHSTLSKTHNDTLTLNIKLFQQSHQLKQQIQKQQIQSTLQLNSMSNIIYQSLSLLKSSQQQYNCQEQEIKQYMKILQRIIQVSRNTQVLNKNMKEFKQSCLKRGLDKENQEWYLRQIEFKRGLVEQEKIEIGKLSAELGQIYHSIEANLAIKNTNPIFVQQQQQFKQNLCKQTKRSSKASPICTLKSSINICSKKGSMNITRRQDTHTNTNTNLNMNMLRTSRSTRNKMFEEVTNGKSEREMQQQKSLKFLRTKLELSAARSRKSTMWG